MDHADRRHPATSNICWLDRLYAGRLARLPLLVSCGYGLLCYAVSALPLWISGQAGFSLDKPLILGGIGIAWVLYACRITTQKYLRLLHGVREVLDDNAYASFDFFRDQALASMGRTGRLLIISAITYAAIMVGSVFAWSGWARGTWMAFVLILPEPWYLAPGLIWRVLAVSSMAVPVTFLLCSTGMIFLIHLRLVHRLQALHFVYSPPTFLNRIQPFLRTSVVTALTWSVGVCLLVILPDERPRGLLLLYTAMAGIGAAGFMLPLLVFRRKLTELQTERREAITRFILDAMRDPPKSKAELLELMSLEEQLDTNQREGTLLIEWRYAVWLFISFILPVGVNVIASKLTDFLNAWKGV